MNAIGPHPKQNKTCGQNAGSMGCLLFTAPDPNNNPCFACAWWDDFCGECECDDDDDYDNSDPYDIEYDRP